ncbi:MAG: type I CRISPR-associated protein Cas7 [Bacteroidetes bacterium]|nr:type I CRISPR-associated protein Cas7 [Bacteroidota bacterium]
MSIISEKSELLFLYESTYSIPNGDPFTGEQRYDEETKKVLVSDVRIKRFIRDFLLSENQEIFVWNDQSNVDGKESGAASRVKSLKEKYKDDDSLKKVDKNGKTTKDFNTLKLLQKCLDVRLFGGISTEEGDSVNLTGPVQFSLLNPSLNEVDLRLHQNTSQFVSKGGNKQGAIGTTTVVPYSLLQIHGWINPKSAQKTDLSVDDVFTMQKALWHSINDANTRTKSNQSSVLLIEIVYNQPFGKIYGVDRLVKITPKDNKRGEQLRSMDDYDFDFSGLLSIISSDKVKEIRYYTEIDSIKSAFTDDKFKSLTF